MSMWRENAKVKKLDTGERRIIAVSDIHGNLPYLRALLSKVGFSQNDELIIDGDFLEKGEYSLETLRYLMRLSQRGNVHAVCGNCDGGDLRLMFPERLRFKCEDVDVLMKHIGGYPGNYDASVRGQIYASPPQLFISGHSHILKVKYDKTLNLLHINPGAAGLQGWHKERTLIRLTVEGNKFADCEVITLGGH